MSAAPLPDDLCAECGMCCDGSLFARVVLQPGDGARGLPGIRVKRRGGEKFFQQPCPAHTGRSCGIYAVRPHRCGLFECRQLRLLMAGVIDFATALNAITNVKRSRDDLRELLERLGDSRSHKALSVRCDAVLNDSGADEFRHAYQEFEALKQSDMLEGSSHSDERMEKK